ncbi:MAG TPA: GerMN domain-containing protein [Mycobacteriales bacterium]|nr:GerMN domain-containing protein [Mycobacteriales bacterium]
MADGSAVSARGLRVAAAVLAAALLPACGLPVEDGVQAPGRVSSDDAERGDIQVLPPGPRPDAGPREIVLGFLGAQTSADGDHALAREFLAREVREEWDDDAGVLVYDPGSLEVSTGPGDERVTVRARAVATIGADGSYLLTDRATEDDYALRRDPAGQLRLVDVPSGLRLTPAGAERSFQPYSVFFLSLATGTDVPRRLVPDRVFLASDAGPEALVRRVLVGPTAALGGAVESAVPPGTALASPVRVRDGVVEVDLAGELAELGDTPRRHLAAQLVWTLQTGLPQTSGVRLLHDGRPYDVPGVDAVQDLSDWSELDPAGPGVGASAVYVSDRTLRRLDGTVTPSAATDGSLPVDLAAAQPGSGDLALVTRDAGPGGRDVVRVGPAGGPFPAVLTVHEVRSLSWGSGDRGLWVVHGPGAPDAAATVTLVPGSGPPRTVRYAVPPGAGPLSALRASRDGARVAAIFGRGAERRLHVGRVEQGSGGALSVTGLRAVAPGLADVADVAWESGTSLVALAPFGTPNRLPVRLAVDGSDVEPVRAIGLDGEPETVAAAPDRPLVVGAVVGGRPVLLVESGGLFRLQQGTGRDPAYPG